MNIENIARAVGGITARVVRDEGERLRFIQQAELAFGLVDIGRVEKYAAEQQRAVNVRDQAADIPLAERRAMVSSSSPCSHVT